MATELSKSRKVGTVWYVHNHESPVFWDNKEDAERYAKFLHPKEHPDIRYSRIHFYEVWSTQTK